MATRYIPCSNEMMLGAKNTTTPPARAIKPCARCPGSWFARAMPKETAPKITRAIPITRATPLTNPIRLSNMASTSLIPVFAEGPFAVSGRKVGTVSVTEVESTEGTTAGSFSAAEAVTPTSRVSAPLPELMDRKKRDIMERKGDKEDENKRQKQQKESSAAAL